MHFWLWIVIYKLNWSSMCFYGFDEARIFQGSVSLVLFGPLWFHFKTKALLDIFFFFLTFVCPRHIAGSALYLFNSATVVSASSSTRRKIWYLPFFGTEEGRIRFSSFLPTLPVIIGKFGIFYRFTGKFKSR